MKISEMEIKINYFSSLESDLMCSEQSRRRKRREFSYWKFIINYKVFNRSACSQGESSSRSDQVEAR